MERTRKILAVFALVIASVLVMPSLAPFTEGIFLSALMLVPAGIAAALSAPRLALATFVVVVTTYVAIISQINNFQVATASITQ